MEFKDASVNLYVSDVEKAASFYCELFGFEETFRTPKEGTPDHVETRKGNFTLGFASYDAARKVHGLELDKGPAKAEIVLWTDDVDLAFKEVTSRGAKSLSAPHDFIGVLRSAWVEDLDGNNIQLVSRHS